MTGSAVVPAGPGAPARVQPQVAATLFGTSDPGAILRRVDDLAGALAAAIRDRDLARRYGDSARYFLHIEGWQLIGSFLGVSARITSTRRLDDGSGWEARAEAVTADGRVLGAAEGMTQRSEPGRRTQTEHALRAMAQVRARRGALRSVLGFVPAIGGLDLSDPDAPATRRQVVALHTLAGERGWDHDEAHRRAGVESFNDLTREQAAELIDAWSDPEQADASDVQERHVPPDAGPPGEDTGTGPGAPDPRPPTYSRGGPDRGGEPGETRAGECPRGGQHQWEPAPNPDAARRGIDWCPKCQRAERRRPKAVVP